MTESISPKHRLMNMLTSAPDIQEAEIEELFNDLKYVYENPFDTRIQRAITENNCTYVENLDQRLN
jgi:hypothetical protein